MWKRRYSRQMKYQTQSYEGRSSTMKEKHKKTRQKIEDRVRSVKGQITWGLKRQATWVSPQTNGKSFEKEWAWERRSERSDEICMWETYG